MEGIDFLDTLRLAVTCARAVSYTTLPVLIICTKLALCCRMWPTLEYPAAHF